MLRAARFAVIGVGAVGNELVKNLVLLGVGEVHIYDMDKVEIHNLTRSVLFRESDVGTEKVLATANRAFDLDPAVKIVPHHGDAGNLLTFELLDTLTAVFCCTDNFEIRLRINQLCFLAGIDLVNTGIDSRFAMAEAFPFSLSRLTGCYECNLPPSAYRRMSERYSCGWLRRQAHYERKVPTTIITSSQAAALAVSMGTLKLRGKGMEGRRVLSDTDTGASTVTKLGRASTCGWCGRFNGEVSVIPSAWGFERTLAGRDTITDDLTITLSDQLIVGGSCKLCGAQLKEDIKWRRAADFDDSLMTCLSCGEKSMDLSIRDQFKLREVALIRQDSAAVKFALVHFDDITLCLDLQGGAHHG
jgi:molybdopterin/thiamine biosynthesis adenylyltransferase